MAQRPGTGPFTLNMPELPISPYERTDIAVANLMQGKIGAAGKALVVPEQLSPAEAQRVYQRLGFKKNNPWMDTILKTVSNPLFIMGAIMAAKWPIAHATKLFPFAEKMGQYAQHMNPLARWVTSARSIFKGTWTLKVLEQVESGVAHDKVRWSNDLRHAFTKYHKTVGAPVSKRDLHLLFAKLDGLDNPKGWFTRETQKQFGEKVVLFKPISLTTPLKALGKDLRKVLGGMHDDAITMHKELAEAGIHIPTVGARTATGKIVTGAAAKKLLKGGAEQVALKGIGKQAHYMPHAMLRTGARTAPTPQTLLDTIAAKASKSGKGVAPFAKQRFGWLVPDTHLLEGELAEHVNPAGKQALDRLIKARYAKTVQSVQETVMSQKPGLKAMGAMERALRRGGMDPGVARLRAAEWNGLLEGAMGGGKNARINVWNRVMGDYLGTDGAKAAMKPQYSMDMEDALSSYVHRWSIMKNWRLGTHAIGPKGTKVGGTMNALGRAAALDRLTPAQVKMLDDRYIPLLQGRKIGAHELAWQEQTYRVADWMGKPEVKDFFTQKIPGGAKVWDKMYKGLTSPTGMFGTGVGASLTSYFYLTTLGLNPASPIKNLLQPLITTANVVESKYMAEGFGKASRGLGQYVDEVSNGVDDLTAIEHSWPAFAASGLAPEPMAREMITGHMMGLEKLNLTGAGRKVESVKKGMMAMFSQSERWNRIWSFYSGRAKAIGDGLGPATSPAVNDFAERLVQLTQFPGGVLGKPYSLLGLPAPLRQYLHFPMRFGEFLYSTTRMGGDKAIKMGGMELPIGTNFGTLGRTIAGSTAMYTAAKNLLGVDLSQGLMWGALPLPQVPGTPFYPFPVVPPALSVAGGLAQAAFTGDSRALGPAASLVVPGGVQARRMYQAMAPKFADYENRGEDGRIPVYDKRGSLVGRYRFKDLLLRGLGLTPQESSEEWAMVEYLGKQRDKIREFRREYMDAMFANDFGQASKIQEQFHKAYPDLGPIRLKKSDITSYRRRKEMTRVERVLQGFTKEYRQPFESFYKLSLPGQYLQGEQADAFNAPQTFEQPSQYGASALPMGGRSAGQVGQLGGMRAVGY